MRKTKLLMSMVLLIGVAMFMWKCQTNDDDSIFLDNQTEQSKRIVNKIIWKDLPFNLQKDISRIDELVRKNNRSQEELLFINQDQIIAVTDSLSNTKYSIKFRLPNQPDNVLYNLVLGHDYNDQEINPFIIKYTISNMDEVYADLEADFTKMRGKITTHSYSSLLNYVENFHTANRNTSSLEEDDCADYSNEDSSSGSSDGNTGSSGGGGTSGSGNSGTGNSGTGNTNEGPSFPTFEEDNGGSCTVNVWTNGTTGEDIGITWSCTDGSSGSAWNDRSNNNCVVYGDVAINETDDVVDSPDDPIEDMECYLECFDTEAEAKVTIYADQPNPDNPNLDHWMGDVGHAFITIEQGGNRVTYGFYPASGWGLLDSVDGVMGDDQNHEFHVSATISVSGETLNTLITHSISFANSNYDLQGSNCTSFAVSSANIVGFNIPISACIGSYSGMSGATPAQLGNYMRTMELPDGATRNTDGGYSKNSVECH